MQYDNMLQVVRLIIVIVLREKNFDFVHFILLRNEFQFLVEKR